MSDATTNATYRLNPQERLLLGVMADMDLWSKAALARCFGVSPKTVYDCLNRYVRTS